MDKLHLPHQKAEALASCTSKANGQTQFGVPDVLKWKGKLGDVPVYDGSMEEFITQMHLLKVEWLGTWHGPTVELPGRPFVHGCLV